MSRNRVMSIQSHVVHGYVGNKAAVFPLQLLGFDVDFINSVHFSNHSGYKKGVKGDVMDGNQLSKIMQGLEMNQLLDDVGYILTGYIRNYSFCEAVLDVIQTLRRHNENVLFVCDPVLGDDGSFYVPKELVKVYCETVIPVADVVTPNQFEVEQLTGISVRSMKDAKMACDALHKMGPSTVFITSVVLPDEEQQQANDNMTIISIIASQRNKNGGRDEAWRIDCPRIPGNFTGTGDLTASLLLGHLAKEPENLPLVMEKVINTMYVVIQRTHESSGSTMKSNELKLIQSKNDIENPPCLFKAKRIFKEDDL